MLSKSIDNGLLTWVLGILRGGLRSILSFPRCLFLRGFSLCFLALFTLKVSALFGKPCVLIVDLLSN